MIALPVWDEIERKREAGEDLTAIEDFIWEETPSNPAQCRDWRRRFEAALHEFAVPTGPKP